MSSLCDGHFDCFDNSDEVDCRIIEFDSSYNKLFPPPSYSTINGTSKVQVNISTEILLLQGMSFIVQENDILINS